MATHTTDDLISFLEHGVAEAAQAKSPVYSDDEMEVEEEDEPKPDHVVAFENFIEGYEASHRLYYAFYGDEDSDDPELDPVQGPGRRRRGANPGHRFCCECVGNKSRPT